MERQLWRQSLWLKESWLWIIRTRILESCEDGKVLTALDVGCGPGYVMDALENHFEIRGVDLDEDMVSSCRNKGLDVQKASAYELPYEDGVFDVVYCTFLMLWLERPKKALQEMARVSKMHVLCLAEPDFGSRIDYPWKLHTIRDILVEGMKAQGADPYMGRKLRKLFRRCGLAVEVGIHPGVWNISRLRQEFQDEWRFVEANSSGASEADLKALKKAWRRALADGTLFQYNPIFYALGRKIS